MRVRNTLHVDEAWVSEALLPGLRGRPDAALEGAPEPLRFDAAGRLCD